MYYTIKTGVFMDFYTEYYETISTEELSNREIKRIDYTLNLIPDDCKSLLEVGCGDGRILNQIKNNYKTIYGVDISKEGLKKVEVPTKLADVSQLPFQDNSFDIVLCCEVLEHIPYETYQKSLEELERVAKKYILISVPNNENLKLKRVTCPICGCSFNPYRHLRKYNLKELNRLFSKFKPGTYRKVLQNKVYPSFLIKILKFSNILKFNFPDSALCPQCGYTNLKYNKKVIQQSNGKLRSLKRLTSPLKLKKGGGWIITCYKKN